MFDKEFKKEFDERMDLLEKARFESLHDKNAALFVAALFYFVAMDEDDICKSHVMKRILNMMDFEIIFEDGFKFNMEKDKSIEIAKYLLLTDFGVENISRVTDLTVDEVESIKKESVGII